MSVSGRVPRTASDSSPDRPGRSPGHTRARDEAERKAALRLQVASASAAARAVFAADKVAKARELRQRGARGALSAHDQLKLEHYRESFEMLAALTPEDALVRRLGRELEALRTMPHGKGTG